MTKREAKAAEIIMAFKTSVADYPHDHHLQGMILEAMNWMAEECCDAYLANVSPRGGERDYRQPIINAGTNQITQPTLFSKEQS